MKQRLPVGLYLVAIFQIVAPLVLPPSLYAGLGPVLWGVVVALFLLLGINLVRQRAWSRTATIFVQGFNILVRLLIMVANATQRRTLGNPLNAALLSSCAISIVLSAIILYYVDLPDIQMVMQ
jgi:hypothetical protein